MPLFEKRDIERTVKVYRVEADNAIQASEKYWQEDLEPVDSYSIDSEEAIPWTEVDPVTGEMKRQ